MRRMMWTALLALAACGADGPPQRPGGASVEVGGSATFGARL